MAPDLFTHGHPRLITGPFEGEMFGLGACVKSFMASNEQMLSNKCLNYQIDLRFRLWLPVTSNL